MSYDANALDCFENTPAQMEEMSAEWDRLNNTLIGFEEDPSPALTTQQEQQPHEFVEEFPDVAHPLVHEGFNPQQVETDTELNNEVPHHPDPATYPSIPTEIPPLDHTDFLEDPALAPNAFYSLNEYNTVGQNCSYLPQNVQHEYGFARDPMTPSLAYDGRPFVGPSDSTTSNFQSAETMGWVPNTQQTTQHPSNIAWNTASGYPVNPFSGPYHDYSSQYPNVTSSLQQNTASFDSSRPSHPNTPLQVPDNEDVHQHTQNTKRTFTAPRAMYKQDRAVHSASMTAASSQNADAAIVPFDDRFGSAQEAREFIDALGVVNLEPLGVDDDDWHCVEGNKLAQLRKTLFEAIQLPPADAPKTFTTDEKLYYENCQDVVFAKCKSLLQTQHNITVASARVTVIIDQIVKYHRDGVPNAARQKLTTSQPRNAYDIEKDMTCCTRIDAVISAASASKYIALDILSGKNTDDLVLSPKAYGNRKLNNAASNANRRKNLKLLKQSVKEEEDTQSHHDQAEPVPRKKKRRIDDTFTAAPCEHSRNNQQLLKKPKLG